MATTAKDRYRASPRTPHTTRLGEDTQASMKQAVEDGQAGNVNEWSERVIEAALGYARCHRGSCPSSTPPIPVTFGDLTGMTFGEAAGLAVEAAEDQHPRHEGQSVFIGAEPAPRRPASPGAVPFMEPAVKS